MWATYKKQIAWWSLYVSKQTNKDWWYVDMLSSTNDFKCIELSDNTVISTLRV